MTKADVFIADGDLVAHIRDLGRRVAADRRVLAEADVKAWCRRRWRHLFLNEAVKDPIALAASGDAGDGRSPRQKIAERYLAEGAEAAWRDEQPDAAEMQVNRTTMVVCPGLLNGMLPVREFRDSLPQVEQRFGLRILRSASHPVRGCEANVADVLRAINDGRGADASANPIPEGDVRPPGDIFVVAYSKGAPDMLTTLTKHPELKSRVKCLFTWAGAVGGSQVADDLARKFKAVRFERQAADLSFRLRGFGGSFLKSEENSRRRIDEFDTVGAIRDLTTDVRQAFLAEHSPTLDAMNIPMFTLRGVTHLNEVPFSQRGGFKLLSKFDPENDMQVTGKCAVLPFAMATELAVLHGHHWDLAYPSFRKRRWWNNTLHPFPKTAALTAVVQLSLELGLIE